MNSVERINHWETIYKTKTQQEVSWYQPIPSTSIDLILGNQTQKNSKIIDVGGGDSLLVDFLLDNGFTSISVLDVSTTAIERAKSRLGDRARLVNWIVDDASTYHSNEKYDVWHDRAAFHFFTSPSDIEAYVTTVNKHLNESGLLILGTFSESGPEKCSGITIQQYSENTLSKLFSATFQKLKCFTVDHQTPFKTQQNFLFCSFKKIS